MVFFRENLETLDVSFNRIESLDSIEGLVNLRVLMLGNYHVNPADLKKTYRRNT